MRGLDTVLRASVTDIPFAESSFDLVTSFDVLCQLTGEADVQALREFRRVLKPKGKLYVRLPAYQWMYANHDRCSHTIRRYTRADLTIKVETAGFRILKGQLCQLFSVPLVGL